MKNITKSLLITLLPSTAFVLALYCIFVMGHHGFSIDIIGLFIIGATISSFFIGLYTLYPARTSRNLPLFGFPILIGLAMVMYASIYIRVNFSYLSIAFIFTLFWFIYLLWYSSFGTRTHLMLAVGETFPNIVLEATDKTSVSSKKFLGSPTIYLFYRGNWCPLCVGQIKELVEAYKSLVIKETNVVFISPQPHRYSEKLAKKYGLDFLFLTDRNHAVAKQLGIEDVNGIPAGFQVFGFHSNSVLPTLIVTDANGTIVFADLTDNYRVRPEPETFLKIINTMC